MTFEARASCQGALFNNHFIMGTAKFSSSSIALRSMAIVKDLPRDTVVIGRILPFTGLRTRLDFELI